MTGSNDTVFESNRDDESKITLFTEEKVKEMFNIKGTCTKDQFKYEVVWYNNDAIDT